MLKKRDRIPRELFKDILASNFRLNTKNFFIRVAESSGRTQIAVSVSKKISKKAVIRNRIRRRVYSALRDDIKKIKPNMYLIVAKVGSEKIKGEELQRELEILQDAQSIVSKAKKS